MTSIFAKVPLFNSNTIYAKHAKSVTFPAAKTAAFVLHIKMRYKARSHTEKSNPSPYTSFADFTQPRFAHGTLPVSLNAARFPA